MAYTESTVMVGKDCKLFINQYDLSGWTNNFGAEESVKVLDGSCFGPSEQSKGGQRTYAIDFAGLYTKEDGNDGLRAVLDAAGFSGGSALETVKMILLPGSTALGAVALHAQGFISTRAPSVVGTDLVRLSAKLQPGGVYGNNANVLHFGAETETADETSVDATAARIGLYGAVAHLSVYAWDSLTSLAVKVQHSANNTDWSDLITFTTATAATSERKLSTGDVYRYRRAIWTIVGTGTCSFIVTFGELPANA